MARYLALDADRGHIHLLAGTRKGGSVTVENVLSWPLAEPLSITNAEAVGHDIKIRLKQAGIAPAPLWVCLGRDRVILKELRIPPVPPKEEPALVRFQTLKDLTESADKVVIDYTTIPESDSSQTKALAVVLNRQTLKVFQALSEAAGLSLLGVTARPFATMMAANQAVLSGAILPAEEGTCVGMLTTGSDWGEFTVIRDKSVLFSRSIGSAALGSEKALIAELRRNLMVFANQSAGQSVGDITVAQAEGPTGWVGRLRDGLPVPVQEFDPLAGVDHDTAPSDRGHFVGLVGAVSFGEQVASINFIKPREPVIERDPNTRPVIAAAAIFALLAIGAFGYGMVALASKDAKLAELARSKSQLDADLAGLELEKKRIEAVEEWQGQDVVWLDEFYNLTYHFPIDRGRLVEFSGKPNPKPVKKTQPGGIAPLPLGGKPQGPDYVANLSLRVQTEDSRSVDALGRSLADEKLKEATPYKVTPKVAKGDGVYLIGADIASRDPSDYTAALPISETRAGGDRGRFDPRTRTPDGAATGGRTRTGFGGFGGGRPRFGGPDAATQGDGE